MSDDARGYDEDAVLHFTHGIPGFTDATDFVLINEVEDAAFQMLQCLNEPEIAFIVTVPWLFFPDYAPEISEAEALELDITNAEDSVLFCPVTIDADTDTVTVNLLGPFVVNAETRQGRQLVLTDQDHPVRAEISLEGL